MKARENDTTLTWSLNPSETVLSICFKLILEDQWNVQRSTTGLFITAAAVAAALKFGRNAVKVKPGQLLKALVKI